MSHKLGSKVTLRQQIVIADRLRKKSVRTLKNL